MIKVTIYLLAFALPYMMRGQAQWGKAQVASRFKNVVYSPDSTIRAVKYHAKRYRYRRYGIDYDTLGRPLMIGKYKHGLKQGGWLCRDGSAWEYNKGEAHTGWIPGCGTGLARSREGFVVLYDDLIK